MLTILSVITAVKDYVEIVHKLIETDSSYFNTESILTSYSNFGAIITYIVLLIKKFFGDIFSLNFLSQESLASLPILVPQVTSAMVSEISVLDGYFHNAFTFLETPLSYGNNNLIFYCLEKLSIGIINSVFLFLPTSTSHLICLRRFVMQGLEAGYLASLGTIAGNVVWIGSLTFGLRFVMIPWLSFDIFRYILGFILLAKYMWDSYSERRNVLEDLSKKKIFLLNFLLAFTEQTNIYPFVSNLSISSDSTFLESFPTNNSFEFFAIHGCYLLGIFLGSFSLLQLTCWFWENPAFNLYMWIVSSKNISTTLYYKILNFVFLYLTMICATNSVSYFALDYTVTNPLGFVHEDRLVDQKGFLETSFLNSKASDRNTRRNRGRHGRRERWKRRIRRYRTFDASLYDQGVYDLFTIEDLNYGFDRFWLRRKIRNHRVHFRFFPGPWMRSFKKQLSRPRLESFMGPRVEFFRILFEQVYHPEFHEFDKKNKKQNSDVFSIKSKESGDVNNKGLNQVNLQNFDKQKSLVSFHGSIYSEPKKKKRKEGLIKEYSALRKFIRKVNTRVNSSIILDSNNISTGFFGKSTKLALASETQKPIYSKRWKSLFSKMSHQTIDSKLRQQQNVFQRLYKNILLGSSPKSNSDTILNNQPFAPELLSSSDKRNSLERLSKKDRQILRYKTFLSTTPLINKNSEINKNQKKYSKDLVSNLEMLSSKNLSSNLEPNQYKLLDKQKTNLIQKTKTLKSDIYKPLTLFHPLKFYIKREQAFQRKLKFYGSNIYRTFGIENNAPYFRTMMRRFFYYYKPTLRWERTMHTATMRKARRKGPRIVRKQNVDINSKAIALYGENNLVSTIPDQSEVKDLSTKVQKPTHFYSLIGKRASRYRYQIYKDVLQHWYYSPFNRFLLKLDVDNFIRRQPNSYFLTKKEEQILHLRRFLLSEYYQTLRWYTYMQHYSSMKNNIGGTKSFASRIYSQQFMGTFKKVRHLFSLTPSFSENNVLKFDQPLYNEYPNIPTKNILANSLFHEELLADDDLFVENSKNQYQSVSLQSKTIDKNIFNVGDTLTDQSTKIIRDYLINATPLREKMIKNLLQEKNYWEFAQFLFKGQKTRGTSAVTNEHRFLLQEKDYLYTPEEKLQWQQYKQEKIQNFLSQKTIISNPELSETNKKFNDFNIYTQFKASNVAQNLWIELLKKCNSTLYDQESLKSYLLHNVDKRRKQQQRQEKYLKNRLEKFKKWSLNKKLGFFELKNKNSNSFELNSEIISGVSTSIQKAIKESIVFQKDFSPKTNINNSRMIKRSNIEYDQLKSHLFNRTKMKELQILEIEKDINKSLKMSESLETKTINKLNINNPEKTYSISKFSLKNFYLYLIKNTVTPFKYVYTKSSNILVIKPLSFINNWLFSKTTNSSNILYFSDSFLQKWRKQEMALTKRKKTRKTLKRLRKENERSQISENKDELLKYRNSNSLNKSINKNVPLRQKQDFNSKDNLNYIENQRRIKSWKGWKSQTTSNKKLKQTFIDNFKEITTKKFKRKRSRLRRYRRLKSRGPIKKRTLGEKLKRQFKLLKRYSRSSDTVKDSENFNRSDKKVEIFQLITKRKYEPKSLFQMKEIKQRRTRLIKRRFWRKHKKQKYSQDKRKQRKRRRYAIGKIRNIFKEYKRIQGNFEVKQWWWNNFLPNLKASIDTNLFETDQQIIDKLKSLSNSEILERDQKFLQTNIPEFTLSSIRKDIQGYSESNNLAQMHTLQIGDKDYKPLAIPQALRIREKLTTQGLLNFNNDSKIAEKLEKMKNSTNFGRNENTVNINKIRIHKGIEKKLDVITKVTQNTFIKEPPLILNNIGINNEEKIKNLNHSPFLVNINPIPFYAGWDETLRKFVVTNRLLSIQNQQKNFNSQIRDHLSPELRSRGKIENFSSAPLKGMNAATTLYWQIPFTTYDPDQFFALGMDGFSPIGWRKFHFRHSKLTTKPILVKTKTQTLLPELLINSKNSLLESQVLQNLSLSYNLQQKIVEHTQKFLNPKPHSNTIVKNNLRRTQKRYKRVKKHPRSPVWFPSGPLTNQVLPVHYIYVFYKRSRLPRDRYIRRRLRKNTEKNIKSIRQSFTKYTDFTLRKRIKPRRKYHRKRNIYKNDNFVLKRRAFRDFINEQERSRPIPPNYVSQISESYRNNKISRRKLNSKQSTENIRIRQLRRRVQRQVIRPVWRYKPRAGGYTWPGDYLKLELIKAPKLEGIQNKSTEQLVIQEKNQKITTKSRKTRKKKRKMIQEWQVQPKKYLLHKHNLKVLKKRLEKSQSSYKMFLRKSKLS